MRESRTVSRRTFLKAGGASLALPQIITSTALGARGVLPASERITLGFIGVGGRGSGHVGMSSWGELQTVAVCDVDAGRCERQCRRVDNMYSARRVEGSYKDCTGYRDFRELLARDDIDAVVISAPDHWHALLSIAAMKAGKDVYCEKPHSLTIGEGRAVCDAARRYGRVFQTGSQERSGRARYGCELVRNGRIGKLHTIRSYLPRGGRLPADFVPEAPGPAFGYHPEPIPKGLDYDLWLGPAPEAPYHSKRCHGRFRWVMDYSDGEMTDRGAHVNDIAMWGNGTDRTGPVEVVGRGEFLKGLHNVPNRYDVEYTFANGVRMTCVSYNGHEDPGGSFPRGIRFEGSDGWLGIEIHGGALTASDPEILRSPILPHEVHLHESQGGHAQDWLHAIRTRGGTVAPSEVGHRTSSLCHLGLIAMMTGRKLRWDPDREVFPDDAEATRMVFRPMRSPWHI